MTRFTGAIFYDAETANEAVNAIIAMDYPRDRISVIMSRQTLHHFWHFTARLPPAVKATKAGMDDDPIAALLTRETSGGAASASTVTRDNGVETIVMLGPAASVLGPQGAGGRAASRTRDVLIRLGLSRVDAERFNTEIESGGIVVGVNASNSDRADVERAIRSRAARNVMETTTTH